MPLETGTCLTERYEILEELGSGGAGCVYRAWDRRLEREVAVKVLDERAFGAAEGPEAAAQEARLIAGLQHPGIAGVFDSGTHAGQSFVVMELVPGRTLRDLLRERQKLPAPEALALTAQVADALDAAHRQGVVHCDIKPQNILVTPNGTVKLVDFGIARVVNATRTLDTAEIHGSAAYLAPEQVRGERLDGRTDIYALGVVLYELLTGRRPFEAASMAATVSLRLVADPEPPRRLEPTIPAGLERVVLRALAREPAQRYATAADLRDALHNAGRATPPGREEATALLTRPVHARLPRATGLGPAGYLTVTLLAAVLLVVGLLLANNLTRRDSTADPRLGSTPVASRGVPTPEPTRPPVIVATPAREPTSEPAPPAEREPPRGKEDEDRPVPKSKGKP